MEINKDGRGLPFGLSPYIVTGGGEFYIFIVYKFRF